MEQGEFQKLEGSDEPMYGPRKLLACGYSEDEQVSFLSFLNEIGFQDLPVIFITPADRGISLGEILGREGSTGFGKPSNMRRTVILSGLTQKELHKLLSAYRGADLPGPLWATLTPVSEKWTIGYLLKELGREAEAMAQMKKSGNPSAS